MGWRGEVGRGEQGREGGEMMFCALVSLNLTMALYCYFKLADYVLPSPTARTSFFLR